MRISVLITGSRKSIVGKEALVSHATIHLRAETVANRLQLTRFQIGLLVVIVVAAATGIAIITGLRLMPPLPFP